MIFSIIIPAKNEESNIKLCIDSLFNMDHKDSCIDFEIIVVDNGSTDNTVLLAKNSGAVVYIKPDLSLSELRNFGAQMARGDILAFLDADYVADKNWLNQARSAFIDREVGCAGSTPIAPEDGKWVEKAWASFRTRRKKRFYTYWLNSSNFFVRKELFNRVDGFNPKVKTCEDVDIGVRLQKICRILFDPSITATHLGEPKPLMEFFKKEIWRGRGTISGLISHGITFSELKSLLIPMYYIGVYLILIYILFCLTFKYLFLFAMLFFAPALLFTVYTVVQTKKYKFSLYYFILFILYANARTVAIVLH